MLRRSQAVTVPESQPDANHRRAGGALADEDAPSHLPSWSDRRRALPPGGAVQKLPQDVGVPGMSRGLLE